MSGREEIFSLEMLGSCCSGCAGWEQEQMATGSVAAGAGGVKTDCCPVIRSCKGFSHLFSDPLNENWVFYSSFHFKS